MAEIHVVAGYVILVLEIFFVKNSIKKQEVENDVSGLLNQATSRQKVLILSITHYAMETHR